MDVTTTLHHNHVRADVHRPNLLFPRVAQLDRAEIVQGTTERLDLLATRLTVAWEHVERADDRRCRRRHLCICVGGWVLGAAWVESSTLGGDPEHVPVSCEEEILYEPNLHTVNNRTIDSTGLR